MGLIAEIRLSEKLAHIVIQYKNANSILPGTRALNIILDLQFLVLYDLNYRHHKQSGILVLKMEI